MKLLVLSCCCALGTAVLMHSDKLLMPMQCLNVLYLTKPASVFLEKQRISGWGYTCLLLVAYLYFPQ